MTPNQHNTHSKPYPLDQVHATGSRLKCRSYAWCIVVWWPYKMTLSKHQRQNILENTFQLKSRWPTHLRYDVITSCMDVSHPFPPMWTCRFPHSWLATYGMILLSELKNLETNPNLSDRLKWTPFGVVRIQGQMRLSLMVPSKKVKFQLKKYKYELSPKLITTSTHKL